VALLQHRARKEAAATSLHASAGFLLWTHFRQTASAPYVYNCESTYSVAIRYTGSNKNRRTLHQPEYAPALHRGLVFVCSCAPKSASAWTASPPGSSPGLGICWLLRSKSASAWTAGPPGSSPGLGICLAFAPEGRVRLDSQS
jgi:hypothetical protein